MITIDSAKQYAPLRLGEVEMGGQTDFDCDSLRHGGEGQWRWHSFPESRMVLNPGDRPAADPEFTLRLGLLVGGIRERDTLLQAGLSRDEEKLEAANLRTAWFPYKLTTAAKFSKARLVTEDFFADRNRLIRRFLICCEATTHLRLNGTGKAISCSDGLLLDEGDCRFLLTLRQNGRGIRPKITAAGWEASLALPAGESEVVACFTLRMVGESLPSEEDIPGAAQALAAVKAFWDRKLGNIPAPTRWGIGAGLNHKGVTPEAHRRAFYAAWTFLYQNILEPTPETGYTRHQVTLGKASLWPNGSPDAPNSCAWESMFCIEELALLEPALAFDAAAGFLEAIGNDGQLEGECLPSQKAHMLWNCYCNLPDKDRLAALYERVRHYLLWRAENPRWIFFDHDYPDEKDFSFVTQWFSDTRYAMQICAVLGKREDIALWRRLRLEMGESARGWFFTPDKGDSPAKIYNSCFPAHHTHYFGDRTTDVENYICPALYADLPNDLADRMIAHFLDLYDAEADLTGFDFYKFGDGCNVAYGLYERSLDDSRLAGKWEVFTAAAIRNVLLSGEFSEECRPDLYRPQGVTPSSFGASTLIEFTYLQNGVRIDLGRPALIHIPKHMLKEVSLPDIRVETAAGQPPVLPPIIEAALPGGGRLPVFVRWPGESAIPAAEAGEYTVSGRLADSGREVLAAVTVR
ncbi:MAG: Ig-like domain-containing protein [Candidatus Howiella sp.]|jgi:hypothetical protein